MNAPELLNALAAAQVRYRTTRDERNRLVHAAHAARIPNTRIGHAMGVTEGAVRRILADHPMAAEPDTTRSCA